MGVINLKWRDALIIAASEFEQEERDAGWPDRMHASQLAALQRPRRFTPVSVESPGRSPFFIGNFPRSSDHENRAHRAILRELNREFEAGNGPGTPQLFSAWLAAQGETPSIHVAAWFDAMGVNSAAVQQPEPQPLQSTRNKTAPNPEQRQTDRYQACIDAKLTFSDDPLRPLPRGIGAVAKSLGIKRQSLAADLTKHIERLQTKSS